MSGLDIDTRSDIYSLGVLLYEFLTGTTPISIERFRRVGYAAMQKLICESDLPKPSTRLSKSTAEHLIDLAENRSVPVESLRRELEGDLDWIVMKALDKERDRRYATANELADDVNRYLNNSPIVARPPSVSYRIRKYAQRNRGLLISAGTVAAVLIASTILSIGFAISARQAYQLANLERQAALVAKAKSDEAKLGEESQRKLAQIRATELSAKAIELERQSAILRDTVHLLNFQKAQDAYQRGDFISAQQNLQQCPETCRNFEWDFLDMYTSTRVPLAEFAKDSHGFATGGSFAKSSTRLITLGRNEVSDTLFVWNYADGKLLKEFRLPHKNLFKICLSPDGKTALVGNKEGQVMLVEVQSGEIKWSAKGHSDAIDGVAFSPNGTRCATASWDGFIKQWEVSSGTELTVAHSTQKLRTVRYAQNGAFMVTATVLFSPGPAQVWDAMSGMRIQDISNTQGGVTDVSVSEVGNLIATAGVDGSIKLWSIGTWLEKDTITKFGVSVLTVDFNSNGTLLAFGSENGLLSVWEPGNPVETVKSISGHVERPYQFAFIDSSSLISYGLDAVKIWDLEVFESSKLLSHHDLVYSAQFSPDGGQVATVGNNRCLTIWDVRSGAEKQAIHHTTCIANVCWSPDGNSIATLDWLGVIRIFEPISKRLIGSCQVTTPEFLAGRQIHFSLDSNYLYGANGNELFKIEIKSMSLENYSIGFSEPILTCALSQSGKLLAAAGIGKLGIVMDTTSNSVVKQIEFGQTPTTKLLFSLDETKLLAASYQGPQGISIWELSEGKISRFLGNQEYCYGMDYSSDGRRFFVADKSHVTVLDATSFAKVLTFESGASRSFEIDTSPDGKGLITHGENGAARIWPYSPGDEGNRHERAAFRLFSESRTTGVTSLETARLIEFASVNPSIRKRALQILAVHGEDAYYLHKRAFAILANRKPRQEDVGNATKWALRATELMPGNYDYQLTYALGHVREGNLAIAIPLLEKLASMESVFYREKACVLATLAIAKMLAEQSTAEALELVSKSRQLWSQDREAFCLTIDKLGPALISEAEESCNNAIEKDRTK